MPTLSSLQHERHLNNVRCTFSFIHLRIPWSAVNRLLAAAGHCASARFRSNGSFLALLHSHTLFQDWGTLLLLLTLQLLPFIFALSELLLEFSTGRFKHLDFFFTFQNKGFSVFVGILEFIEPLLELLVGFVVEVGLSKWEWSYSCTLNNAFILLTVKLDYYIRLMRFDTIFIILCLLFALAFSQGEDYDWSNVEDTVEYYRANGAFPGGVLRVSNGTHKIYEYAFGHFSKNQLPFSSPSYSNDTIFDLASLTKVTATLTCIMHLYEEGKVGIDDLVTKFIPEYANHGKEATTIRNLLLHNAGLLPDYPYTLPKTKQQVMKWTYNCTLDYPIATKFVYSDLSFILLGEISERVSKKPLQVYSKQLMEQMGMPNSSFLPDLDELLPRIAPAEYSPFRKTLIRGKVHDPTAYLFGGVAGHAGFFSIAEDLQTYMQIHLNGGVHRNGTRVYNTSTVNTFFKREDGLPYNNRRALGWDTVPIQTYPPCGTLFSMNSFGHTGYTGTSIWTDREKNLIVVLLTNRVYPTDRNNLHVESRSKITDAIVRTLGLA